MGYLVLVRHGESRWNLANKFTGWVDIPLSEVGINEAQITATKLEGLRFDIAFTSELTRAQETLLIILSKQNNTGIFIHSDKKSKKWSHHSKLDSYEIPIYSSWALNERYYGDLQGLDKEKTRKKYGAEQVHIWRRSYDVAPPNGESLKDTYKRVVPYFTKKILPEIKKGKNVIVAAHGNSLRAIIKYIDKISNEDIPHLELQTGKPYVYKYSRGKLKSDNHVHSFNRPLQWTKSYSNKKYISQKKEVKRNSKNK